MLSQERPFLLQVWRTGGELAEINIRREKKEEREEEGRPGGGRPGGGMRVGRGLRVKNPIAMDIIEDR